VALSFAFSKRILNPGLCYMSNVSAGLPGSIKMWPPVQYAWGIPALQAVMWGKVYGYARNGLSLLVYWEVWLERNVEEGSGMKDANPFCSAEQFQCHGTMEGSDLDSNGTEWSGLAISMNGSGLLVGFGWVLWKIQ
jgi:hypothetical protein